MLVQRQTLNVKTDASGAATVYSDTIMGQVVKLLYVPDPTKPFTLGFQAEIEVEQTGEIIFRRVPRGIKAAFNAITVPVYLSSDRFKFVITGAGDAMLGKFIIIIL